MTPTDPEKQMRQILSLNLTNGGKVTLVVSDPATIEIDEIHNDSIDAVRVTVAPDLEDVRTFVVTDSYDALTDRLLEMCRKYNAVCGIGEKA